MSFESAFADLLTQTLTIAPVTSRDKYGAPTYGSAVSYSCRVVEKLQRVVDSEGREGLATTVAWCRPHTSTGIPDLGPEAKVTLPDGTTPALLAFEVYPDEDGDHHFKLLFDRSRRLS